MRLAVGKLLSPLLKFKHNMATQLTPLPEIERLSPGCIRILGGNPGKFTLQGTNTYLIGTGPNRLLIDTGEGKPSWITALTRVLHEEKATITSAIITHWHHDHTGGVADLLKSWPGTKIYKHQPESGQLDIEDGQTFQIPGASLTAVHAPGHTADHMVLVWPEEDALFTGDNVLGHGTAVFEDLGAYMASLEKMKSLFRGTGTGTAYPGHGPVIPDGPGKIAEYIRHRGQREQQVVQALLTPRPGNEGTPAVVEAESGKGSAWTVMDLVKVIYRDVPESLHPAAAGGIMQILQKLQREGKVSEVVDGDEVKWRLGGRPGPSRSAL
ncbi:beta-lactamase-like protein [Chaetomium strumarium]|uniref:Beta-lactamase-like protein n=1 Tax=Chaetomium strumarium TaxID=1170767 RepID=A0AAJ0M1H7_9PEZI|nr:beta-lactamase-like protein [Chaetomium strumarium]